MEELDIKNYIHNSLIVNIFQDSKCSQVGPSQVHSKLSMNQKDDLLREESYVIAPATSDDHKKDNNLIIQNQPRIIMKRRKVH